MKKVFFFFLLPLRKKSWKRCFCVIDFICLIMIPPIWIFLWHCSQFSLLYIQSYHVLLHEQKVRGQYTKSKLLNTDPWICDHTVHIYKQYLLKVVRLSIELNAKSKICAFIYFTVDVLNFIFMLIKTKLLNTH